MFRIFIAVLLFAVPFQRGLIAQSPAQSSEGPVVITTGEGLVKLAPDRVWVTVAAESRAKGPKEAQRANVEAMSAVLAKVKALGLAADAVRTSGYDLQPEFDYANGRQTLRGYVAQERGGGARRRHRAGRRRARCRGRLGCDVGERPAFRSEGSRGCRT